MATKSKTFGTRLAIRAVGDTSFLIVEQTGDITGLGQTWETTDVTTHDSPGGAREYQTTVKDGGEVTFPVELDLTGSLAGQNLLNEALASGEKYEFGLIPPGGTMNHVGSETEDSGLFKFSGFVTKRSQDFTIGGSLQAEYTIRSTGIIQDILAD